MANTDYGAIPLTLATAVSQALNHRLGVSTGFKPSEWADNINLLVKPAEKTASGSIAHFTDGLDTPLVNGKFGITAYQDGTGTPSPSNVRAIHGYTGMDIVRTGKNLVCGRIAESSINASGKIGAGGIYDMVYGRCVAGQTYTITSDENQLVAGFFYDVPEINSTSYDGTRKVQNNKTYTAPITGYMAFRVLNGYASPQLELGSSATAYSAYNGTTYPLTWQNECYGGYIDYARGKKVTTHGKKKYSDIAVADWRYSNNSGNWNSYLFYANIANRKRQQTGNKCEVYDFVTSTEANVPDDSYILPKWNTYMYIRDDTYTSINDFLTAMGDKVFVYELETPIEEDIILPIISVLNGENNIWNTCGDSEVTYRANPS